MGWGVGKLVCCNSENEAGNVSHETEKSLRQLINTVAIPSPLLL